MQRRDFVKMAAPFVAAATVRGANDRVNVGIVGLGGRARWLIEHEDFGFGRIAAVADCWRSRCDEAAKLHPDGAKWNKYASHREMFDKEKLDAVFVETTTHARVFVVMEALAAGLDVYAEKPLTLTVEEGQILRKAVAHSKRVLQTGTQQRSMPISIHASNLVASGKIGKVEKVIVCNFLAPERWRPQPSDKPQPTDLDWNLWTNQAELRPYHTQLHRNWSNWWDYDGGGQSWGVSGWGTHALDQVQAALGTSRTGPVELTPSEPGDKAKVSMRYENGTIVSLEQAVINDHQQLGAIFVGSKAWLQILRGDYVTLPELRKGAPPITVEGPGESSDHLRNFFECVKSRAEPNASVEIGHRSNTVCHLVNICRDLGRKVQWDPVAEKFVNDDEANRMLSRPRRKGFELPKVG